MEIIIYIQNILPFKTIVATELKTRVEANETKKAVPPLEL